MSTVSLKVSSRKNTSGAETWEGSVALNGLRRTKLEQKDGSTSYDSRQAVMTAARNFAKRYEVELQLEEPKVKAAAKKATKKPAKARKTAEPTCSGTSCESTNS